MKRIATALLLSTVVAAPAFAANQGGYVAVDVGQAAFSGADFAGPNSNVNFLNPGTLHLTGGYHFNQNLGLEGGLVANADSSVTTIGFGASSTETLKSSALYVAAVGTLPISSKFDLFGEVGLASTKIDYTSTGNLFGNLSVSGSKTNVMFGLGGRINFSQHWGMRIKYENFGKTDLAFPAGWLAATATTKSIGLSTFTVGGIYSF
jgi:OOP family OmpA-OmpF porin